MHKTMQIRAANRDDFTAWLPSWEGYNAFYGRTGETALPSEVTAITWEKFFDAYEPMFALVAEQDGELLGLAHYLFHRSTTQIGPTCYLQYLFVKETARGNGVGQLLISEIFSKAKALGIARVYWMTYETDATAMWLYVKMTDKNGIVVYRKAP